jgi:hypothetical protein
LPAALFLNGLTASSSLIPFSLASAMSKSFAASVIGSILSIFSGLKLLNLKASGSSE